MLPVERYPTPWMRMTQCGRYGRFLGSSAPSHSHGTHVKRCTICSYVMYALVKTFRRRNGHLIPTYLQQRTQRADHTPCHPHSLHAAPLTRFSQHPYLNEPQSAEAARGFRQGGSQPDRRTSEKSGVFVWRGHTPGRPWWRGLPCTEGGEGERCCRCC